MKMRFASGDHDEDKRLTPIFRAGDAGVGCPQRSLNFPKEWVDCANPRWVPDNEHLVYVAMEPSFFLPAEYRSVAISGRAPTALRTGLLGIAHFFFDLSPSGYILFWDAGQFEDFDPANKKQQTIRRCPANQGCWRESWSPDGNSVVYIVQANRENDPDAGIWSNNFRDKPRQVLRGWVLWYTRGPNNQVYVFSGKGDLSGTLWRVGWDGQGLTRVGSIPPIYPYWIQIELLLRIISIFLRMGNTLLLRQRARCKPISE